MACFYNTKLNFGVNLKSVQVTILGYVMQLTGQFQVEQWNETTDTEFANGSKLNHAKIQQKYSGDIEGTSQVHYHLHYSSEMSSVFNGFEYLTCQINGQSCNLVFKHNGQFKDGVASSNFEVIEADNAPELLGKTGSFEAAMGGQASYQIAE